MTFFTTQLEFSSSAMSKPQQLKKTDCTVCACFTALDLACGLPLKELCSSQTATTVFHGYVRLPAPPRNWKPTVDPAPAPPSRERLTNVSLPRFPPGDQRTSWNPDQDSDCRLSLPSLQLGKNAVVTSRNVWICCGAPRWSLNVPGALCCSFQNGTA